MEKWRLKLTSAKVEVEVEAELGKRYEAKQLSKHNYTTFTKGVLGKPSNLTMGGGASKIWIALFYVLDHCSYAYNFLMMFLFFRKKSKNPGG